MGVISDRWVTLDTQLPVYITNQNFMLDILILRKEEPEIRLPLCCVKICSLQHSLVMCARKLGVRSYSHLLFLSDQTVFDSSNTSEGVSLLGHTTPTSTKESLRHGRTKIAHRPNNRESERCGVDIALIPRIRVHPIRNTIPFSSPPQTVWARDYTHTSICLYAPAVRWVGVGLVRGAGV